jgi:hypothetical protein
VIVSGQHRFGFVHVQKTGGLSVASALRESFPDAHRVHSLSSSRHAGFAEALAVNPGLCDYFWFGFVRNPWARMYSWHAMVLRRKAAADAGHREIARKIRGNSFWAAVIAELTDFEDFVLRGPDLHERLRTPQLDYLSAPGRRVDLIGRTETLTADLTEVYRRLGRAAPVLPRRNVGPPADYRSHYTSLMRARVREVFAADIDEFGYEF